MKRFSVLAVLFVVLAIIASACGSAPAAEAPAAEAPAAEAPAAEAPAAEAPAAEAPAAEEAPAADAGVAEIKVGALYPLTGPDAGWAGDPYIKSHQLAIDEINAAGGIECLGGAKLVLVNGDTEGSAEAGNSEMERLITQEGVVAVMGSALSGTTLPATQIAEKYEVPYIVPNALDGEITNKGLTYIFQTVSTLQQWGADDAAWVKAQGAQTAVITTPDYSFGAEVADTWRNGINEAGIELLEEVVYAGDAQDFSDTILKVKNADPDVWFLLGNNQAPQIIKQANELGYYPKMGIISLGSGFGTTFFLNEVGGAAMAEGIVVTGDFAPVSALNVSEELKTKFKEYTGQELGGTYNTTYASTFLLADALEAACSTDPKVVAETLRTTTFTEGEWQFQWPEVSFDEKGRLQQAASVIAQWQNGEIVAIWPDSFAAGAAIWPVPSWDAR